MEKIKMILTNSFKSDIRVLKEASTLAKCGYEVEVLCWDREHECLDRQMENLNGIKIKRFYPYAKYGSGKKQIFPFVKFIFEIAKYLKNKNYDIIHAHDLDGLVAGKIATFLRKKDFIYDSHEFFSGYRTMKINKKIYWLERIFLRRKDHILTVSESICKNLNTFYNPKNIEVIRNIPFEKKIFSKNNLLREEFKIKDSKTILLYQGGFSENRGLKELIEIIKRLDDTFVLVFIGKGDYKKELEREILEKKIEYKVYFKDFVENSKLLDYTNSADIGIYFIQNTCLNHYYCLPNKIFEFIQGEIPILTSNFPELDNLISKNKLGMVVDYNKVDEIEDAIKKITFNNNEYIQNIKRIKKELNWEKESKKLINFYEKVVKR